MTEPRPKRLRSLDVLRGFDMFWLIGGRELVLALVALTTWQGPQTGAEQQLHHAEWHGFTFWDLVFPLFLFLAGCSLPLSFAARRRRGASTAELLRHSFVRGALLVFLGAVYNGLLAFELSTLRIASVLGRIGVAWMGAAWIVLAFRPRGVLVWSVGLLLAYGVLLALPVSSGAPLLERGSNIVDRFDQQFLPGRLHRPDHDPEGLLSTIPAVVTVLAGALVGLWMRSSESVRSRSGRMAGVALLLVAAGVALHPLQPVNKNLWTPAYTLLTAGLSLLLLSPVHRWLDSGGTAAPLVAVFAPIGRNPLLAYLLWRFLDFGGIALVLTGRALDKGLVRQELVAAGGGFLLLWFLLRVLDRRGLAWRI